MRVVKWLINGLLAGCMGALLMLAAPKLLGYRMFAVTSPSMEPEIHTGDLIYVKRQRPEKIREGDVITFTVGGENTVVTHRVWRKENNGRSFLTKGDANEFPDKNSVSCEEILGTVTGSVPWLGYGAVILGNMAGKLMTGALMAWLFFMGAIIGDLRTMKKEMTEIEEKYREKNGGIGGGSGGFFVCGRRDRSISHRCAGKAGKSDYPGFY